MRTLITWLLALPSIVVAIRLAVGSAHSYRWHRAWRHGSTARDLMGVEIIQGRVDRRRGPADQPFAMGSVTKGITGMLFQIAIERGELSPDDPLGRHLPLDGSPAADIPLRRLADHTSGLPRLSGRAGVDMRTTLDLIVGRNPYRFDLEDVLGFARGAGLQRAGRHQYSNLGAALLGQALARAAGRPFPDLAHERVFAPLGLTATHIADGTDARRPMPAGRSIFGRRVQPWVLGPMSPAGGMVTTRDDLERLLAALAAKDAPGIDALTPRQGTHRGMGWFWSVTDEGIAWHNGQVGGASAAVAVAPGTGCATGLAGRLGKALTLTTWTVRSVRRALKPPG